MRHSFKRYSSEEQSGMFWKRVEVGDPGPKQYLFTGKDIRLQQKSDQ